MTNWIERLPQKSAFKIQYDFSGIIIQYESAKSKVFDTIYMWKFSRRWIRLSTSRSWERRGLNQLWRTNTSNSFQGPIFERCNNPMRNCQRIKQNAALWERSLPFWAACGWERCSTHNNAQKGEIYERMCCDWQRSRGDRRRSDPVVSPSIYFSLNQIQVFHRVQMRSPRSHSLNLSWSKESFSKCRCIDSIGSEKIPAMSFFPPRQRCPSSCHCQTSFYPNHKLLKAAFRPVRKNKSLLFIQCHPEPVSLILI